MSRRRRRWSDRGITAGSDPLRGGGESHGLWRGALEEQARRVVADVSRKPETKRSLANERGAGESDIPLPRLVKPEIRPP